MISPVWLSVGVALLWGTSQVVYRFILPQISFATTLFVSAFVYAASVFVYVFVFSGQDVVKELREHASLLLILVPTAFFGLFVANVMYMYTIKHAKNINIVTIIMGLYPIVTLLLAALLLREGINGSSLIGFIMILCGMVVMLYNGARE